MSVNKVNPSTGELELIAGGTLYADTPIGTIQAYGGASSAIPQGWLYCNGAAVSRTDYAELFAVIGTSFGTGDGSTTFNIPDLRGEFLRGAGTNSHTDQGNGGTVGQHQDATIIPRIDSYGVGTNASMDFSAGTASGSKTITTNPDKRIAILDGHNLTIMADTDHSSTGTSFDNYWALLTTRPTNTSVNYIIKAKQVALPADFTDAIDEAVEEVYGDIIPSDASSSNKLATKADMIAPSAISNPALNYPVAVSTTAKIQLGTSTKTRIVVVQLYWLKGRYTASIRDNDSDKWYGSASNPTDNNIYETMVSIIPPNANVYIGADTTSNEHIQVLSIQIQEL